MNMLLRRLNPVPYIKQRISNAYTRRVERVKARFDEITTLPVRFQGTVIERWTKYWKWLIIDYSSVLFGILKDAKNRPVRALIITGTGTTIYHCAQSNPSEVDFRNKLRFYSNEMGTLPESMQKQQSKDHLLQVERLYSAGRVRRLNIGVASLFYRHDNNSELKTYQANCSYTGSDLLSFRDRIVEVGFLDRFWILNKEMKDYDVNE